MKNIRYKTSKWRLIVNTIIMSIFCIIGICSLIETINNPTNDNEFLWNFPQPIKILICIIGILIFGFCMIICVKLILRNTIICEITDKYLIINNNIFGNTIQIDWTEIKKISKYSTTIGLVSQCFIGIEFYDNETSIQKLPKREQKTAQINIKTSFPPISISFKLTKYKIDEIITEMNKRMENAKR